MGLLSLTPLLTGAAKEVYTWQEEAQQKEDIYNENLAKAVNNVNKITQDLGNKYDDAVRLSNLVGGGSFANYLMDAESLDRLSNIYNLAGDDRDKELLNLKKNFDRLDKSKYEDLDFTETAKQRLEKETQAVKTEQISAVGKAPTPSSKFEGFITRGARKSGEQIREDIMTGITPPEPTAEYKPLEGGFAGISSPKLTLKQKSANVEYFYNTLQEEEVNQAGIATGEYVPKKGQEPFVNMIKTQANDLILNGFAGSEEEAIAEVIQKNNNPNYNLPLLTDALPNSPRASELLDLFLSAKSTDNQLAMEGAIDEANQFNLLDLASDFQLQYDNYIKSITDKESDVSDTTITTDVPEGGLIQKGKVKTIGALDYISPEEKLKNSQVEVTENFIQQVMQKNNTSRQGAINILKDYGYIKFPEKQSVTSTVKGRIKGE
jgi:hypothetical protein